jgi:hypothetical protein
MFDKIKSLADSLQIDYAGVADLKPARDFILKFGGERAAKYPFCVSLGIALPNAIVDSLPERERYAVKVNYRTHAYDFINHRLN